MRISFSFTTLMVKLAAIKSIEEKDLQSISPSHGVALIGLFSALCIVARRIVPLVLREASRCPEHFLRGLLMRGATINSGRMCTAKLMGLVGGIIFVLLFPKS